MKESDAIQLAMEYWHAAVGNGAESPLPRKQALPLRKVYLQRAAARFADRLTLYGIYRSASSILARWLVTNKQDCRDWVAGS